MRKLLIPLTLFSLVLGIYWINANLEKQNSSSIIQPVNKLSVKTTISTNLPNIDSHHEPESLSRVLSPPNARLIGIVHRANSRFALLQHGETITHLQSGDIFDEHWQVADIKSNQLNLRHANQTAIYRLQHIKGDHEETQAVDNNSVRLAALKRMESEMFRNKIKAYLKGRQSYEVAYPMGVESEGVVKYDDVHYGIDRSSITKSIDDRKLVRHIKMSFSQDNAEIMEIVPGSVFDKGGLQVGDKLERVNGKPLKKPTELALLYATLYTQDSIELELTRSGETMSLQYELQDR